MNSEELSPYGGLLDSLPGDPSIDFAMSDHGLLVAMVQFESELAEIQCELGLIPSAGRDAVVAACERFVPDAAQIGREAAESGTPVLALLAAITVDDAVARRWIHYGTTSQDCLDTAMSLRLVHPLMKIWATIDAVDAVLRDTAGAHVRTPMLARSLGQSAAPTTYGFKVCGWLEGLSRSASAISAAQSRLAVQCGGAVGTLSVMGTVGPEVAARLAHRLALENPAIAWHSDRSRMLGVANALCQFTIAAGKIATDVIHLAQGEVAEVTLGADPEQAGRGRSSAMAHKRNPVAAVLIRSAALQAPHLAAAVAATGIGAQERSYGEWQAEWRPLRELAHLAGGAAYELRRLLRDLRPDPEAMLRNLSWAGFDPVEVTRGVESAANLTRAYLNP